MACRRWRRTRTPPSRSLRRRRCPTRCGAARCSTSTTPTSTTPPPPPSRARPRASHFLHCSLPARKTHPQRGSGVRGRGCHCAGCTAHACNPSLSTPKPLLFTDPGRANVLRAERIRVFNSQEITNTLLAFARMEHVDMQLLQVCIPSGANPLLICALLPLPPINLCADCSCAVLVSTRTCMLTRH